MSDNSEWQTIESAPRDGRPVWVTGWNFGKVDGERHYCWAYWHGDQWNSADAEPSHLQHLTHWMPT